MENTKHHQSPGNCKQKEQGDATIPEEEWLI